MNENYRRPAVNQAPGVPNSRPVEKIEDVIIDEIFEPDPVSSKIIGQVTRAQAGEVLEVVDGKVVDNKSEQSHAFANEKHTPTTNEKTKGTAQMVAGAALVAAGIPTMILPGVPSTLMIVGGWSLAAKGQRAFSGREISKFEQKTEVATEVIKKETKIVTGGLLSKLGEACTKGSEALDKIDIDKAFD